MTGGPLGMKRCAFCGEPVAPGDHFREITGWEKLRSGGGGNAIADRKETGRVCCKACSITVLKGKGLDQQPGLW